MKFGGTSVANVERIRNVAAHVKREVEAGHEVAVVVSAMAGQDQRAGRAGARRRARTSTTPNTMRSSPRANWSTSGLLALVLRDIGLKARSWQGWQIPILTDDAHGARPHRQDRRRRLIDGFKARRGRGGRRLPGPAWAANRVTTLGRGGSDTSAVALAAAIHADRCDIYTDVDGVYTTDPRIVPKARRLDKISFEEMLEMASLGAKVLQVRSVEVAMVHKVRLYVRSSFDDPADPKLGTLICDEEDIVEQQVVTGIAFSRDEAQITLRDVADKPGVAAAIFGPLAEANINVDMIIQVVSEDAATTDITFTVSGADFERAKASSSRIARRSATPG